MGLLQIPPEVLAKMSQQQRARIEATMKGAASKPTGNKQRVTKDDLSSPVWARRTSESCKYTVVTFNRSQQDIRVECSHGNEKEVGTIKIEAVNSETIKGTIQVNSANPGRRLNINSTFTGKWIGSSCSKE
jgi:hypothetical protein